MPTYCYVYVLRSTKDGQFYVGLTRELRARLQAHNNGQVASTGGLESCHYTVRLGSVAQDFAALFLLAHIVGLTYSGDAVWQLADCNSRR